MDTGYVFDITNSEITYTSPLDEGYAVMECEDDER